MEQNYLQKTTEEPLPADKMRRDLALIEAALYVSGRPLELKTLCSLLGTRSKKKVENLAKILTEEYRSRDTALEILRLEDERFVLQLKAEYTPEVRRLALKPLLSAGPLKTLSYIAYRQPVSQKLVIDVRGTHAYGHVKQLEEMGLIERERSGRGMILRTSKYFADYFGLSDNLQLLKKQLRSIFAESFKKTETADAEEEPASQL